MFCFDRYASTYETLLTENKIAILFYKTGPTSYTYANFNERYIKA